MSTLLILATLMTAPATICTSEEAMVQYTKDVSVNKVRSSSEELKLFAGECVAGVHTFEIISKTPSFSEKGVQYSILKIQTSEGVRYAMYFEPALPEA